MKIRQLAVALTVFGLLAPAGSQCSAAEIAGWNRVPEILGNIVAPSFPDRDFLVTDFGAVGDGGTDSTDAFRKAIAACHSAGGGRVVAPAGRFLTGPIHLKSNVNLHVSKGATILFSTDSKKYLPQVFSRVEGIECMNYSPLIYAFEQENVAVTGEGTLDGQAGQDRWWHWKGPWSGDDGTPSGWKPGQPNQLKATARLREMGEADVPVRERVFGEGDYLRPSFIQPYRCRNVLIEGITVRNSPMWNIHPVLSTNVTVRNVTIVSHGPNNDGCNPESSKNVLIEGCHFDTGDDCIAIKAGRNRDGRRVNTPSENIVIRDCRMKDGHGGVVIGSETSGGIRNVFAEDCLMDSPHLGWAVRIKSNSMRGGRIENIFVRNIQVGQVAGAVIRINMLYSTDRGEHYPEVRNVEIRNVTSNKSRYPLWMKGLAELPVRDVRIEDCVFNNVEHTSVIDNVEGLVLNNVVVMQPR